MAEELFHGTLHTKKRLEGQGKMQPPGTLDHVVPITQLYSLVSIIAQQWHHLMNLLRG